MTFLNQFHKEVTERKMRKIAASQQSPISSSDFAQYMKRNVEIASKMYEGDIFVVDAEIKHIG